MWQEREEELTHHRELSLAAAVSVDEDAVGSLPTVLGIALEASGGDVVDDIDLLITLRSL
jgi:hypothetical protein